MNTISLSRRKFAQLLGGGAAAALVRPVFSIARQPEHIAAASGDVVRLSANENPYGPSPNALKAMTDSFGLSCRYPDEHNNVLIEKLAKLNSVNHDQILLGDGSGEILKLCAETFTGQERGPLIAADPTFEAILKNATASGAEVVKIPLTSDFAHDLLVARRFNAEGRLIRRATDAQHIDHGLADQVSWILREIGDASRELPPRPF